MNDHLKPAGVTGDAIQHLDAAVKALSLEACRADDPSDMSPVDHFTIAEDLKRIDSAIGPKGESIFAKIADSIQEAYVEILAARNALVTTSALQHQAAEGSTLPPTALGNHGSALSHPNIHIIARSATGFTPAFSGVFPMPPAIDGGRFEEWSLADFAGQCRMQSREQLDPEFSQFMAELSKRLAALAEPAPQIGPKGGVA